MDFYCFDTPLGTMALAGEENAVTGLYLPGRPMPRMASRATDLLAQGRAELLEYLEGKRKEFDLPLKPNGTEFQCKVWAALQQIPYGQTCSYREIAVQVGCPQGFRAVGMANHRNPIPIFIPCHRVVGANGTLVGYAGGLDLKQKLLSLEQGMTFPEPFEGI
ncbi:MAG: methylated-DNA--[protein]-cysteine S-methyltransferase [Lawsonibacter sp.]|jgi:methylated-DNA-[protein]-cysteine S-methyltransferase